VFYYDTYNVKSYKGEPTTNIWSIAAGTNINAFSGWSTPNGGTAAITSSVVTNYGSWDGNRIWLVSVGSGTLVSYGAWRLCVNQPTAGSDYPSTRRLAVKIRMLTGAITNIGVHSGGGTGAHNASDFTNILEKDVPLDCMIKDGWVQMLSDVGWSSTTVSHCVGIGLNNSGPYSFLVTEPMYYPSNKLISFTPTSRSNTQGLLDLTRNCTIDLNSASFDSSANISFNGTSAITLDDTAVLKLNANKSFCMWVNMTADASCGFGGKSSSSSNGMSLGYGWSGGGFMALAWNSANAPALSKDQSRDIGKWVYLAAIQDGSTRYIYAIDSFGVRSNSFSGGNHTWNNSLPLKIGRINDYAAVPSGTKIDGVSVYSRALTENEILKNFNRVKSRYGY
jgi:hypothetical protein